MGQQEIAVEAEPPGSAALAAVSPDRAGGRRAAGHSPRILAHVHTFNDADIIDRTIEALLRQTRPVTDILIVDNNSTDGTLDQSSVRYAAVVRHPRNEGTSGAVNTGFRYALERNYDWVWVFDADSVPQPDALEKLLDLYAELPQSRQEETAFLACLHSNIQDGAPRHGGLFTENGLAPSMPVPETRYYLCHFTIWSGCLYRMDAVRQIGLPNTDYQLDWGEGEYGYQVLLAGYKGFIHQDSVLHHNIRGFPSITFHQVKIGPLSFQGYETKPIRCYYTCRNVLYFALYEFKGDRLGYFRRIGWRTFRMPLNFMLRPRHHGSHILACWRGIWHALTGNITARY